MPQMVGDFDDNANPLWSLHAKETKSHDEARIQSPKDSMDGVLIFVHIYIYYCMPDGWFQIEVHIAEILARGLTHQSVFFVNKLQ